MKQNLFGYKLAAFFVIVGALLVIGLIGEASEPRCIKTGCDNKQTRGSSYCYLHEPYTGSSTSHSSSSYSNKSYGSTSKSSTSSNYSNKSNSTNKSSYSSGIKKVKVKSFAPRQIQRRLFAALITLSRKVFRPWHKWF